MSYKEKENTQYALKTLWLERKTYVKTKYLSDDERYI